MTQPRHSDLTCYQAAALAGLLLVNMLVVALMWGWRGRLPQLHSGDLAAIYLTQGQYALLAAWCAWGTGRLTIRWLIALVSLAAITLTFNDFAVRSLGRYSDGFFGLAVGGAVVFGGWYAIFLPLRWLLGCRVTFDGAACGSSRGQFRLKHWLGWTATLGVPLAVAKLLYPGDQTIGCLFFCVMLALPALPFVVGSFRVAFSPRPWLWSAVAVLAAILVGVAEESVVVHCLMEDSGIFTWQARWMQIQQMCGMNLGLLAGLLGNLLALRLIGMRFVPGQPSDKVQRSGSRRRSYLVPRTEYKVTESAHG